MNLVYSRIYLCKENLYCFILKSKKTKKIEWPDWDVNFILHFKADLSDLKKTEKTLEFFTELSYGDMYN